MRLSNFTAVVCPRLAARDRTDCIQKCTRALLEGLEFTHDQVAQTWQAIIRREQLGTTNLGRGIALPHSRLPSVDRLRGGLFTLDPPLDWNSIDGIPVSLVYCLLSPHDRPGDHLRAEEAIVRTLRDDEFVNALLRCETADEMWEVLRAAPPGW